MLSMLDPELSVFNYEWDENEITVETQGIE